MNPQSNIKKYLYAHGMENISKFVGCSIQTLYTWKRQGFASPPFIEKLSKYPNSIMTEAELLDDVKVNKQ